MLENLENLKKVRVNDEGEGYDSRVDEQIDEFAENSPSSCWVGSWTLPQAPLSSSSISRARE